MGVDMTEHWSSKIEISDLCNTEEAFERVLKFHSIPALTKYIRSRSLLCAPDIDDWRIKDLFQRIFLSTDPENEDLKELVYDCLYLSWLKGDFLSEFAPERAGSNLLALQKPSGGICGISPVDIWRRDTGHGIVQSTQQTDTKTCIDTYPNFKQLALTKDGGSHCQYFLNDAYSDPAFTSVEDTEDPMVIVFVLDFLSGKTSRDYACGIKVDEDFDSRP